MHNQAQFPSELDVFSPCRQNFEQMLAWLRSDQVPFSHADTERQIWGKGIELMRLLYQAHLDHGSAQESRPVTESGTVVRPRLCDIESVFGRVQHARLAVAEEGKPTQFPRDKELNLPPEVYSLPVRERVAEQVVFGSMAQATKHIEQHTGAHVPKRQVEELTIAAAQDVQAFYAQRTPANDTTDPDALLVGGVDSSGIRMRIDALRPATRKKAEEAAAEPQRKDDPMLSKGVARDGHRMAVVTVVYDQARQTRSVDDIVASLASPPAPTRAVRPFSLAVPAEAASKPKKTKRPPPQNKTLRATVTGNVKGEVVQMFQEMARRDPDGTREKVMVADGEKQQRLAIEAQAKHFAWHVTLVLDLIHVLHYLWVAAKGIYPRTRGKAEGWVQAVVRKLLTETPEEVLAHLREELRRRNLTPKARKKLQTCLGYLTERKDCIHYAEYLVKGYPIASGVIEGACRSLVKDRMAITGARWGLAGAEAVLGLRAVVQNGDVEAYWRFHEQQEFLRNYPAIAA